MFEGQCVKFRSAGVLIEGFVTRLITTDRGVELGAIVSSPNSGSFFLRSHRGRAGDRYNMGRTESFMRDNRAAGI